MNIKTLETKRLILKNITWNDVQAIHEMNSFKEVAAFNTIGIPKDIWETKNALRTIIEPKLDREKTQFIWVLRKKKTNQFIGEIGLTLAATRFKMGEIHYSLHPNYWNQGYAIEAVKSVINYCFEELKLHRIEAGVATENSKSIKLLEKVGMLREGLKRKILPIKGKWTDNYHYAILENDFRPY